MVQILPTPNDNLFEYITKDDKSLKLGIEFVYPYIIDKSKWYIQKTFTYGINGQHAGQRATIDFTDYENCKNQNISH